MRGAPLEIGEQRPGRLVTQLRVVAPGEVPEPRGVEKQNSMMTTSAVLGTFRRSEATRTEFLTLIARRHL